MVVTKVWEKMLYPHTGSGHELRSFLERPSIWDQVFDAQDRKIMTLVKSHQWAALAYAVRQELRSNLGKPPYDPSPRPAASNLFHPWRRILRPKMVMLHNRNAKAGVTL